MYSSVNMDLDYKFTGQEFDEETGLYNFRARLYDSDLAAFYGADPAGQGYNSYSYAANNPVINIDKDGRFVMGALFLGAISGLTYSAFAWDKWNWRDFGKSFIGGAITGGVSSLGGALAQNIGYGMLAGLTGNFLTSAIYGDPISAQSVFTSLLSGAFTGALPKFQGINSGWLGNIGAELLVETGRSAFGNALASGIMSQITDNNFGKGFSQGLKRGAIAGAAQTTLNIMIFGSVISPEERAGIEQAAALESDMSDVGLGLGAYGPAIRSGGIASLSFVLNGRGTTVGNNLNMPRFSTGELKPETFIHEMTHYYQQIYRGFGGFMARGIYEQINSTLYGWGWGGYNPYLTPGNMEWISEKLTQSYFN